MGRFSDSGVNIKYGVLYLPPGVYYAREAILACNVLWRARVPEVAAIEMGELTLSYGEKGIQAGLVSRQFFDVTAERGGVDQPNSTLLAFQFQDSALTSGLKWACGAQLVHRAAIQSGVRTGSAAARQSDPFRLLLLQALTNKLESSGQELQPWR